MGCLISTNYNNTDTLEEAATLNLVPIKESTSWIPLNTFPFSLAGKYVINEYNKLYMLPSTKIGSDPIYTYNMDYYQWIPSLHYQQLQKQHTAHIHKSIDIDTLIHPQFAIFNNELHLIGGRRSIKHYVFDTQINKFKLRSKLVDIHVTPGFGMVYIASKQCLYLFAGTLGRSVVSTYSTATNAWGKLNVELSTPLFDFGITLTSDNRYVLLFGGRSDEEYSNDIYIFDVDKCVFKKSTIKCPPRIKSRTRYKASIINDYCGFRTATLIIAYIRIVTGVKINSFPNDLIHLINSMCTGREYVYLAEHGDNMYCSIVDMDGERQWIIDL
eukprot:25525_1